MKLTRIPLEQLSAVERKLIEHACAATERAYAPYSRFNVGAAILLVDNTIVTGSNFENISYGLSLCAETVAIATVNSAGRMAQILQIAIACDGLLAGSEEVEITPCGRCRQVIAEATLVAKRDIEILMLTADMSAVRRTYISKLLPLPFSPKG
jgi:cytidine deaminase